MAISDSDLLQLVHRVSDEYDADILAYYGDVQRREDDDLIASVSKRKARKNVILFLTTRGGDPHVAYRLGRCLQRVYSPHSTASVHALDRKGNGTFSVCINSLCKSAGTILACGADRIYMTDRAELGPIDAQLRKQDEIGERTSGLTPIQALAFLESQATSLFKQHFSRLRFDEDLVFSTKMAADLATNMTVGLLSPIYSQIDPIRLAEMDRYLKVAHEYVRRLARNNLKDGAIERLIAGYPSHSFVIDYQEAKSDLFHKIDLAPELLVELAEGFRPLGDSCMEDGTPWVSFLNDRKLQNDEQGDEDDEPSEPDGPRVSGIDGEQSSPQPHPGSKQGTGDPRKNSDNGKAAE